MNVQSVRIQIQIQSSELKQSLPWKAMVQHTIIILLTLFVREISFNFFCVFLGQDFLEEKKNGQKDVFFSQKGVQKGGFSV